MSDAGVSPGSGVGNKRAELSEKTLGVPVVAIGIPTVVDAATIVSDALEKALADEEFGETAKLFGSSSRIFPELNNMYMTGKDVDEIIKRISFTISEGINIAMEQSME